jgi:hypothetical protein
MVEAEVSRRTARAGRARQKHMAAVDSPRIPRHDGPRGYEESDVALRLFAAARPWRLRRFFPLMLRCGF